MSNLFQLGKQAITITVFAKLVTVHTAVFLLHVLLERTQQIACCMVEQVGFGL